MPNCVQCGIEIPSGQRVCSMCYGDPEYGRDGYYREWLDEQYRQEQARREQEQEDAGN
jgi:hypothetical protein